MNGLFDNYGFLSCGILHVSPHEAFELCGKGAVIVDVREEYLNNFKHFDVPKILYIPLSKLVQQLSELPMDNYLIFADSVGLRSKEAVVLLKNKRLKDIANMAGGIVDWERDGLPLKTNVEERLSGSCMCQLKPRGGKKISKKMK
jgi:rhodanese-related sulfurtransferase